MYVAVYSPGWEVYGAVHSPGWEVYGTVHGPGWEVYGAVYDPGWKVHEAVYGHGWEMYGTVHGPGWEVSMVLDWRCKGLWSRHIKRHIGICREKVNPRFWSRHRYFLFATKGDNTPIIKASLSCILHHKNRFYVLMLLIV